MSLRLPRSAKPVVSTILKLMRDGRAAEAASELANLDRFEADNPMPFKLLKGQLQIDLGAEMGDVRVVAAGLGLAASVSPEHLPAEAVCSYWYNLGNGHSALLSLKKLPPGIRRAQEESFRQAKRAYRTAMASPTTDQETAARLYTNYGNLISSVGRHVEAIGAYDNALEHKPEHAMATLNKGTALCEYSNLVGPPTKRSVLIEAQKLLTQSVGFGLDATPSKTARRYLTKLEQIIGPPKAPSGHKKNDEHSWSEIESEHVAFCLGNRLYLHPCPLTSHRSWMDPLAVAFPTENKREQFELVSDELAVLKQEYVAARFLLFTYRTQMPDLRFVNEGTFLPRMDRKSGDIYAQLLVLSFRTSYSILDKIAYFMNHYCAVGLKEREVYFREELFLQKKSIRPQIARYDGDQMAAIYDLCAEFSWGSDLSGLKKMRHHLEHRCVAIDSLGGTSLESESLYQDALKLLQIVRAAIFYLYFFVRRNERPPSGQPRSGP
jgi:tetratricopeptide (TPR) repeat protein